MEITITINTDNDAFADGNLETEVARILNYLAARVKVGGVDTYPIKDINGNTVGEMNVLD